MYYHLERGFKICEELKSHIYSDEVTIQEYEMVEGKYHDLQTVDNEVKKDMWNKFHKDALWGDPDAHYWFRTSCSLPERFKGQAVGLQVFTDKEGWDYVINPQFMLYINGEFIQGLDLNHRETLLTDCFDGEENYKIDLHSYTGRTAKNCQLFMKVGLYHGEVEALYYDCYVPLLAARKLEEGDYRRDEMIEVVNEAINLLDLRRPHSPSFFESIKEARIYMKENFYNPLEKKQGQNEIIATCVGHTHIDVAWWWTVEQTREKVARSFSTVLKLMEEYPEYVFMSSQPVLYKFLKEDHPKLYAKLKERVKEGRWEPEGGMWVEADCNVTSGESLVRQLLHGTRFFEEEFGVTNDVLWLPDVFGYNGALPQILKKSGINYFMTTKISWNQYNKLPCDTFYWQGTDGTKILTHLITTTGPDQDKEAHFTTYNGMLHPGAILGAWRRYQQKVMNKDILVCYGYGDGGGGPTKEMLEMGRRMEKGLPGIPTTKMGTSKEYFKGLETRVKTEKFLPSWVGELYLEYHRGTYTSMGRNKRSNRKCEFLYQDAEFFNMMASLYGHPYPKEKLYKNWETILTNQFHDILPGSSIKEVYDVTKIEYEKIEREGHEMVEDALTYLVSCMDIKREAIVIFNSLSFKRDGLVRIPYEGSKDIRVIDESGKACHIQFEEDHLVCHESGQGKKYLIIMAKDVPSKGYKTYRIEENTKVSVSLAQEEGISIQIQVELNEEEQIIKEKALNDRVDNRLGKEGAQGEKFLVVSNQYFTVTLNEKGEIIKLFDHRANRHMFSQEEPGNRLIAYEDKPMYYDNWDIDIYYKEKGWIIEEDAVVTVVEEGPVRKTIRVEKRFMDSTIRQLIHLYEECPRIDFETYVDWKEKQTLMKVQFPTGLHVEEATYDIQFGNVKRPTHQNTSWDMAKFEVCGHKWVDVAQEDYGLSVLNDCKYGHNVEDNIIGLTLIKSGIQPNETTDQEEHYFTYSIFPHKGSWQQAGTAMMAYQMNVPLYGKRVEPSQSTEQEEGSKVCGNKELYHEESFFRVDQAHVFMETVKRAEDSGELVLRLYSNENRTSTCQISSYLPFESVDSANLMEKERQPIESKGNTFTIVMKPYELKTFIVSVKKECGEVKK